MIGWISLPGAAPASSYEDGLVLPTFEDTGVVHTPTPRGPKVVVPDDYFGPDINASTGVYVPPSADVLASDASYRSAGSGRSRPTTTAKPASLVPWFVAGGVVVAGGLAWWLFGRRA